MADQPINGLPKKATAADTDALLMIGASEEYQIDYGKLADAILNKLTNKTFTLDQGSKSLVAALNELNSNLCSGLGAKTHLYGIGNLGTNKTKIEIHGVTDEQVFLMYGSASSGTAILAVFTADGITNLNLGNKKITIKRIDSKTEITGIGQWFRGVIISYNTFKVVI